MEPREYEAMRRAEEAHFWYRSLRAEALHWVRRRLQAGPPPAPGPGGSGGAARAERLRVLDLGCGTGGMLRRLEEEGLPLDGFGMDYYDVALSYAREGVRAPLFRGDAKRLPLRDETFDVVLCLDVLYTREAYPGFSDALAGIRRILRPGGLLVLQLPAFPCLRGRHDEAVHGAHRFRKGEVRAALRSAGFARALCYYRYNLLFAPAFLLRRRRRNDGGASDLSIPPPLVNGPLALYFRAESLVNRRLPVPFGVSVFAAAWK